MLKKLGTFFSRQEAVDVRRALTAPIDSPDVLDLLWSAYACSKNPAAVRRIISVLDRKDIVRDKLERWLATVSLEDRDTASMREILAKCEFPIDYSKRSIGSPLDLDLHAALCARAGDLKFAELPFQLAPNELVYLAMKSAALWSLKSMAKNDATVVEICEEESGISGGASRLHLRKEVL